METNEKRRSKDVLFIIIVVLLVVVLVGLIGFAYARYITIRNGQAQAPIASWNFNVTAGSRQDLVIDLATTRNANDTDQVDRSTVAPGTSGVLQLNVNASGTETSLEYNINLNLSQVPPNLIFYYDQNMQNAIYKENNAINLTGFFDANNSNKTATRNIYWKWPLETGSTATEINNNDLLDSQYMGRNITMAVVATGTQVMQSTATANQGVQVTFDANGGTLQGYGNSGQMTKSVVPGEQYGSLPVPTRPGYRFLGWNGKNLLNYNELSEVISGNNNYGGIYVNESEYIGDNSPELDHRGWTYAYCNWYLNLEPGTYTVTVDFLTQITANDAHFKVMTSDNDVLVGYPCKNIEKRISQFSLNELKDIGVLIKVYDGLCRIQIERGNTSTDFEPYYITQTTEVVQNGNHTLTAIWEEIA